MIKKINHLTALMNKCVIGTFFTLAYIMSSHVDNMPPSASTYIIIHYHTLSLAATDCDVGWQAVVMTLCLMLICTAVMRVDRDDIQSTAAGL